MNPYRPPYPNELYHHGIKGQRWGVRNGPPYPLSSKVHASVVKRKRRGKVGAYIANNWEMKNYTKAEMKDYGITPYNKNLYSVPMEKWEKVSPEEVERRYTKVISNDEYKKLRKSGKLPPGSYSVYGRGKGLFNFLPEHRVPTKTMPDWTWDGNGRYRYFAPEGEGYSKKKRKKR